MQVDFTRIDRAFTPRRLVVIGDRAKGSWLIVGKEFTGEIVSVQVNPETAKAIEETGIKNYQSLLDVPGEIDLVIVSAPRSAALKITEDCIARQVGAVHFFTAGFSETDTREGAELERIITEKAKAANLHLIGPNCMGIYNPSYGLGRGVPSYSGYTAPISLISQSGTHATGFCQQSNIQGIDVSKAVSFGNGLVLDGADFLEYFDYDSGTKVIGMYLEGVRDGRRFLKVLKKVAAHKPVVIWKGGRTEEGDRAIASHTASLAISYSVWKAAVRQCGAVPVSSMEELIDTMKALLYFPPVCGERVGITGGSGGPSVAIADIFAEAGLKVPRLTETSYSELASFFTLIGGGYRNPVDTGNANRREIKRIMEILVRDANIDSLTLLTGARQGPMETTSTDITLMEEIRKMSAKPVMAIVSYVSPDDMKESLAAMRKFQEKGVAAFSSMERGARALKNALDFYRHRNGAAD